MHEIAESASNSDHYLADDSQEYNSFILSPSAANQQRAY